MNHGVAAATEDLILFTDADVVHRPTSFVTGISILTVEIEAVADDEAVLDGEADVSTFTSIFRRDGLLSRHAVRASSGCAPAGSPGGTTT